MALVNKALSPSTRAAYQRAWVKFKKFCDTHSIPCKIPIASTHLACFITFLFNTGQSASSIASCLSALSYYHKVFSQEVADPTKNFVISQMMIAIRKERPATDSRKPITEEILFELGDKLPLLFLSFYEMSLFKAMFFYLMFYFGLRVSEVTTSPHNLPFHHVQVSKDRIVLTFSSYKHGPIKPFKHFIQANHSPHCPVAVLLQYTSLRGKSPGAFFLLKAKDVSQSLFSLRLKQTLKVCTIDPNSFSSHSFRIGAASKWAAQGLSYVQMKRLGRWNSEAGFKYLRNDVNHSFP